MSQANGDNPGEGGEKEWTCQVARAISSQFGGGDAAAAAGDSDYDAVLNIKTGRVERGSVCVWGERERERERGRVGTRKGKELELLCVEELFVGCSAYINFPKFKSQQARKKQRRNFSVKKLTVFLSIPSC